MTELAGRRTQEEEALAALRAECAEAEQRERLLQVYAD
jgi:hypothetical protein